MESYQHNIDANVKNIIHIRSYYHDGRLAYPLCITEEIQRFYFKYMLIKSAKIICQENHTKLLTYMLKVFSMFGVMLEHEKKDNQNNLVGAQIRHCNCNQDVYFKLNSRNTNKKFILCKSSCLSAYWLFIG